MPVNLRNTAVDTTALPVPKTTGVCLEDVERRFELAEDEDFMPEFEEAGEEGVEKEELAGGGDERVVDFGVVAVLFFLCGCRTPWPVEVVGRVAGEAGLHDGVLQFLGGDFFFGELEGLGTFDLFGFRGEEGACHLSRCRH